MDDTMRHFRECELFQHLSVDKLKRLEAACLTRNFERGDRIFNANAPCDTAFLLVTGRVRIFHILPGGKQILLALVDPGELVGELAATGLAEHEGALEPRGDFAEAMEPSRLIVVPRRVLAELLDEDVGVAKKLAELIGSRRIECEKRLKSLLFRSICDRLVLLLLELAQRYGEPEPQGVRVAIRLSHQDFATAIGSARETVTNVLGQLQGAGLIKIDRRQVVITDPDRLAAIPNGASQEYSDL